MALILYSHPFASYCQKVLIALYENATPFSVRLLDDEQGFAELAALWPHKKFPVLTDGEATLIEASIIIEYLDGRYCGPVRFIADDAQAALHTRFLDRFFDNYVMSPMQKVVGDSLRAAAERDPAGVAQARAELEVSYRWLEALLAQRPWAAGGDFSLADCAAAPALFYASTLVPFSADQPLLQACFERLVARPSVARVLEEAKPYLHFYPCADAVPARFR